MTSVRFREEARDDIEGIAAFISQHDEGAAARVVQRIHHVIYSVIGKLPLCGRFIKESGTREFSVPGLPYIVIYLADHDAVEIIAVFHTSRDPKTKRRP